jgi:3-dehydroquinate dehydratase/shikimate dehydrogenase
VFQKGRKIGHNTDYRAAMDTLEEGMGGLKDDGTSPLMDKQVLILGAGGAARSISFGCSRRGANVTITNRHDDRATKLAEEVGCRTVSWSQRASTLAEIVVNCTPVGMHPDVDDTPVPPATFSKPGMIVFDTIYHPENTMLLKLARERECIPLNGVDMFVGQAAEQFKLYTGMDAPKDVMRAALKRKFGPVRS